MPRATLPAVLLVVALSGLWWACGNSTGPSNDLLVGAPSETVTVGAQVKLTATIGGSNGERQDVSSQATWSATPAGIVSIDATGLATALASGTATVTATYGGQHALTNVTVVTPTFKVSGSVTDAGGGGLSYATVTATAGGSTQQATTNSAGGFSFGAVLAGPVQLQASAPGFQTNTVSITLAGNATVAIPLTPTMTPVDVSGNWTVAIAAPPGCAGTLPANARTMGFIASITQADTQLTINLTLGGVPIIGQVPGTMAGSAFAAELQEFDDYDVVTGVALEKLGPTQWLGVFGTIAGTAQPSASSFSATLTGRFNDYETAAPTEMPQNPPANSCSGTSLVTFTRVGSTAAHRRR